MDLDGDTWTSLVEYQYGTSPIDPTDALQLRSLRLDGGSLVVEFTALADRTYSLLYRSTLEGGAWLKLRDVPAETAERIVEVIDPIGSGAATRFYRVVSPAWP
jgi:hypothetical protein